MIDGGTSFEVKIEWKTRITNQGGRARGLRSWFAKSTASGFNSHFLQQNGRLFPSLKSELSNQNTQQALALPEKEVIQPHLPVRLPCYDFTTVTSPAFGIPLLAVKVTTSGMASSYSVTGGVYKAQERIHRRMVDRRLLAIPASCRRVAACNPN
ncbi:hypothetical protein V6N13_019907 [Hibiscus sabdariffa]